MSLGRKPSLFWSSFRIDSFFREPKVGSENLSNSHPISQLNMHNHGKQHVKRSVCQWLFRKTSLYDNLCWKFICKSRNLDFNVNECFIIQENPLCNHFRVFILSHGLKWRWWHHVTYISPSLTPPILTDTLGDILQVVLRQTQVCQVLEAADFVWNVGQLVLRDVNLCQFLQIADLLPIHNEN